MQTPRLLPTAAILSATALLVFTQPTSASSVSVTSGLQVWLDAGNVNGTDNAGLSDGDTIATWANISPDAASIGDFAGSGELKFGVRAGQPVMRFDGTSDQFTNATTIANALSSDMTIFAVADDNDAASRGHIATTRSGVTGWALRYDTSATVMQYFNTGDGDSVITASHSDDFHIFELSRDGSVAASALGLSIDGDTATTATGDSFAAAGSGTRIAQNLDGANSLAGDIAEVLIYDRVLSAAEVAEVGRYLSAKYAIGLNVDFGATGAIGTQAGFRTFEEAAGEIPGTTTKTFDSYLATDGDVDVSVFATTTTGSAPEVGFRDRDTITGTFASESDLLGDFLFADIEPRLSSGTETLHLVLDDLAAGLYEITTYHHDRDFFVGNIDILLDDAMGSDQLIESALVQSTGSSPTSIATATFSFLVDGSGTATIKFREIDGTASIEAASLAGFELVLLPQASTPTPEPSMLMLAALGLLHLAFRRRRKRTLTL